MAPILINRSVLSGKRTNSSRHSDQQNTSSLQSTEKPTNESKTPSPSSSSSNHRRESEDTTTSIFQKFKAALNLNSSSTSTLSQAPLVQKSTHPPASSASQPSSSHPSLDQETRKRGEAEGHPIAIPKQEVLLDSATMDDLIRRLLEVGVSQPGTQVQISESLIRHLCLTAREIFLQQPNLLELGTPMKICGDIHGQYSDLLRLFQHGGFPEQANYLFLGDYVDYSKQSIETICLLLAYKIKYPENFFLLRGAMNPIDRFYGECKKRYNVKLWKVFTDCFHCLPVAALIDDNVLCMHGGICPDLTSLDQIRNLHRPTTKKRKRDLLSDQVDG